MFTVNSIATQARNSETGYRAAEVCDLGRQAEVSAVIQSELTSHLTRWYILARIIHVS